MRFGNNFIKLTSNVMLDPITKVIVTLGRYDVEDASQIFEVSIDRNLRADQIWRELTTKEINEEYMVYNLTLPENNLIPNISVKKEHLFTIIVYESDSNGDVHLSTDDDELRFYFYENILKQRTSQYISDNSGEFIKYLLHFIFFSYKASRRAGVNEKPKSFLFFLEKSFAQHLPNIGVSEQVDGLEQKIIFERLEFVALSLALRGHDTNYT